MCRGYLGGSEVHTYSHTYDISTDNHASLRSTFDATRPWHMDGGLPPKRASFATKVKYLRVIHSLHLLR